MFKALHRTRQNVFQEDERALTAARIKINEEFKKNKDEVSEEKINKMTRMASDVEMIFRTTVIQGEHIGDGKIQLRARDDILNDNHPYLDDNQKSQTKQEVFTGCCGGSAAAAKPQG